MFRHEISPFLFGSFLVFSLSHCLLLENCCKVQAKYCKNDENVIKGRRVSRFLRVGIFLDRLDDIAEASHMLLEATESGGDAAGYQNQLNWQRTLNPWQRISGISLHDGTANPSFIQAKAQQMRLSICWIDCSGTLKQAVSEIFMANSQADNCRTRISRTKLLAGGRLCLFLSINAVTAIKYSSSWLGVKRFQFVLNGSVELTKTAFNV